MLSADAIYKEYHQYTKDKEFNKKIGKRWKQVTFRRNSLKNMQDV